METLKYIKILYLIILLSTPILGCHHSKIPIDSQKINSKELDFLLGSDITPSPLAIRLPLTLSLWEFHEKYGDTNTECHALMNITLENLLKTQTIQVDIDTIAVIEKQEKSIHKVNLKQQLIMKPLEILDREYYLFWNNSCGSQRQVAGMLIYKVDGKLYTLKSEWILIP